MTREEIIMSRAFELARRAEGMVSPNPLVGAVLVYDNNIISEGWHEKYGEAHAEVNAINGVDDEILRKSELFVSLEPCNHFGKTPPCSDLIVNKKIQKVFTSVNDPNPLVSGSGIEKLQKAGVEVKTGILEKEGRELNRRFLCRMEKGRPYIILKWAESQDGFIAKENGNPLKISNEISQRYSHKLRAYEDAIMVGTTTVLNDNPSLTNRYWPGTNPKRISIDLKNKFSKDSNIFNEEAETIIYNLDKETVNGNITYSKVNNQEDLIDQILNDLSRRSINSLIVEGGKKLLDQFIERKIWDEVHVFKSMNSVQKGLKSPKFNLDSADICKILKTDRYYFFKIN